MREADNRLLVDYIFYYFLLGRVSSINTSTFTNFTYFHFANMIKEESRKLMKGANNFPNNI